MFRRSVKGCRNSLSRSTYNHHFGDWVLLYPFEGSNFPNPPNMCSSCVPAI